MLIAMSRMMTPLKVENSKPLFQREDGHQGDHENHLDVNENSMALRLRKDQATIVAGSNNRRNAEEPTGERRPTAGVGTSLTGTPFWPMESL